MSPSGTLGRVYQALKARVMAGGFEPGERIDPTKLSAELSASVTPIRDALHRLAGERLVESWQQEGFRQPIVTEAGLRDLYGWSEDLLRIVLRGERLAPPPDRATPELQGDDLAVATAAVFAWIAERSPNHEHRTAIASLNDRAHSVRLAEQRLLGDARAELAVGIATIAQERWIEARRWNVTYHAARIKRVADIAALFRRRPMTQ